MITLAKIILLIALALFLVLAVMFVRLLLEDTEAVEIELREVER